MITAFKVEPFIFAFFPFFGIFVIEVYQLLMQRYEKIEQCPQKAPEFTKTRTNTTRPGTLQS